MPVLTDYEMKWAIKSGSFNVDPFDPAYLNPTSIDLRLNRFFSFLKLSEGYEAIDPSDKNSYYYEDVETDLLVLEPNGFVLGSTLEKVTLGRTYLGRLGGKSSVGRIFLDNSSFAGVIDAGFSGFLTLEFVNHSSFPIYLKEGMRICQLMLELTSPVERDYGERLTSKYMNQKPAQGAL